ncbi:MAG: LysM peptidoglycan-binding domain-containing protein [Chthoniobacterales bacterium]
MKLPKFIRPRKKLRATTARRSLAAADEMDYEEMSEPNMKLSRALLIVLVLHVVAVAGIIAFNSIKSRQGAFPAAPAAKNELTTPAAVKPEPAPSPVANISATGKTAPLPANPAARAEASAIPKALPATAESGNFYVVAKGDNPVKIAKHLKVSESDLLAVNHIEDPRKLQIGQKLIVPAKAAKTKKSND